MPSEPRIVKSFDELPAVVSADGEHFSLRLLEKELTELRLFRAVILRAVSRAEDLNIAIGDRLELELLSKETTDV